MFGLAHPLWRSYAIFANAFALLLLGAASVYRTRRQARSRVGLKHHAYCGLAALVLASGGIATGSDLPLSWLLAQLFLWLVLPVAAAWLALGAGATWLARRSLRRR